jgi:FkbM family methyltransferase
MDLEWLKDALLRDSVDRSSLKDALLKKVYRPRLWLRRCGFEVVPKARGTLLGLHLWTLFDQYKINVVIDVGARRGEYGNWLRRNGYKGWIVSFEPVSESYGFLAQTAARDPHWRAFNLALGREHGEATINVTQLTFYSSFRNPSPYAYDTFGTQPTVRSTETVTVATLDEMFDQVISGISDPHVYLKMDTQGWDLEVLKGAPESLMHVMALQSEIATQAIYDGMPMMRDSLDYLDRAGFAISGLFPVNLDRNLRAVEFDCVAVRSPDSL